jgi:hypothetical protein
MTAFKDDELKLNELDLVSGGGYVGGKNVSAATSSGLNHPETQGLPSRRPPGGWHP